MKKFYPEVGTKLYLSQRTGNYYVDMVKHPYTVVGQAKELTVKARDLQSKTDQFLKQDLYHIIGMGNLSASQSAALNKLVKDITAYRTVVKAVAAFPPLPNAVHKTSTYKATAFGLKLKNKTFVKN